MSSMRLLLAALLLPLPAPTVDRAEEDDALTVVTATRAALEAVAAPLREANR